MRMWARSSRGGLGGWRGRLIRLGVCYYLAMERGLLARGSPFLGCVVERLRGLQRVGSRCMFWRGEGDIHSMCIVFGGGDKVIHLETLLFSVLRGGNS